MKRSQIGCRDAMEETAASIEILEETGGGRGARAVEKIAWPYFEFILVMLSRADRKSDSWQVDQWCIDNCMML